MNTTTRTMYSKEKMSGSACELAFEGLGHFNGCITVRVNAFGIFVHTSKSTRFHFCIVNKKYKLHPLAS